MACLLQMYSTCIEIYKNPVLFWQRYGYGTIQTDDTVSTAYNLLFYQHAEDSCKDGTKDSQQTNDVLGTYSFRLRAVKEDRQSHLRMIPLASPTEGRDGRICMRPYVIVCLSRQLLPSLQISPYFSHKVPVIPIRFIYLPLSVRIISRSPMAYGLSVFSQSSHAC